MAAVAGASSEDGIVFPWNIPFAERRLLEKQLCLFRVLVGVIGDLIQFLTGLTQQLFGVFGIPRAKFVFVPTLCLHCFFEGLANMMLSRSYVWMGVGSIFVSRCWANVAAIKKRLFRQRKDFGASLVLSLSAANNPPATLLQSG